MPHPKPWDYERCKNHYLDNPPISLKAIAELSGVSIAALRDWSKKDPAGTWAHQRSTPKKSEKSEHLELASELREVARKFLRAVSITLSRTPDPAALEEARHIINAFGAVGGRVPLQLCSSMITQAIAVEREALHLDLEDPAILERAANRQGLSLIQLELDLG